MPTHQEIDERSLRLARAVALKVDQNLSLLDGVRDWASKRDEAAYLEWSQILQGLWPDIREVLLDPGEEGKRLRQSSPFVGILTPTERWAFYPVKSP